MAEMMASYFLASRAGMIPLKAWLTATNLSPILAARALPRSMSKPVALVEPAGSKYSCGGYETSEPNVSVPAVNSALSGGGVIVPDPAAAEELPHAATAMAASGRSTVDLNFTLIHPPTIAGCARPPDDPGFRRRGHCRQSGPTRAFRCCPLFSL